MSIDFQMKIDVKYTRECLTRLNSSLSGGTSGWFRRHSALFEERKEEDAEGL